MAESVRLHVALQEGFDGDRVEVVVAGSRYDFPSLSTRNQIGLADEIELDAPVGPVEARVALPDRSLDARTGYQLAVETWLAVNLVAGTVEFAWAEAPFFYA